MPIPPADAWAGLSGKNILFEPNSSVIQPNDLGHQNDSNVLGNHTDSNILTF